MSLFAERNSRIDSENAFKVGPHIFRVESQKGEVIKLNLGEPDFAVPVHIKDEVKRQLDLDNTKYCDPKGLLSLREAICKQINQTRGLQTSPEHVVVFPGGKPPIGLAQQIYCNHGDEVIYPSPGFPIYESFIRYVGAVPVPLHLKETDNFTFSPDELAAKITPKTKLIYLNFPSNPTGAIASAKQLEDYANVILENCTKDIRVYSDEIYENIIYDGEKHHSISSIKEIRDKIIIASVALAEIIANQLLVPKPNPIAIPHNKYIKSLESFITVLNLIIESEPTKPIESAILFPITVMITEIMGPMSKRVIKKDRS